MKFFFSVLLCFLLQFSFANNNEQSRILVHTLNYLGQDYPNAVKDGKVINYEEYEEMEEFCESSEKYFLEFSTQWSDSDSASISQLIKDLTLLVKKKAPFEEVAAKSQEARNKIIAATGLKTYPSHSPDLVNGKKVFATECVKCHGITGKGDGPEGAALNPKPRNFHDEERMSHISPAHVFNTVRFGLEGTGMKAYPELKDDEVWDVAFYILTLRLQKPKTDSVQRYDISLEKIATSSDEDLRTQFRFSQEQINAVRYAHSEAKPSNFLNTTLGYLSSAEIQYHNKKNSEAMQAASLAYLEGIEPIEHQLKIADPELSEKLEEQIQRIRKMISDNRPASELSDSINAARQTLKQAENALLEKKSSFWMLLLMSASIFLREGLEAFLVILVILSVSNAANIQNAKRWVHAGWILAVFCGIILWLGAEKFAPLLSSNIELTEGIISLVAVLMLIYVGFWLHGKSEIGKWKEYVNSLVKNAVDGGSAAGLASLSFFVVFREVFESVLFLAPLSISSEGQQTEAIMLGIFVAFIVVLVLAFFVLKYSARLPIPKLFKISSLIIAVLAVILAGKGIHSLQVYDMNLIPSHFLSFSPIEVLGIYPTVETCAVQILVLIVIAGVWKFTSAKQPQLNQ